MSHLFCQAFHLNHSLKPIFKRMKSSSWFSHIEMGPPDPILGVREAFKLDKNPKKVNLGAGTYVDDNGKPWILPSVRKAEKRISARLMDKEYPTIIGISDFYNRAIELALGCRAKSLQENLNATTQSISGTGALYVAATFLSKFWQGNKEVYIPTPSYANHAKIFPYTGLQIKYYRYYDPKTYSLDFNGLKEDICKMPKGSIILLHPCGHNPTGVDLNCEQWFELSQIIKNKELLPFFDMAYQGFASGDVDRDAFAVRLFELDGHQMCLAQSFAKNMGLYGERVGALTIICKSKEEAKSVLSQIQIIIRTMYITPPLHGARIVGEILNDTKLTEMWLKDVKLMANRVKNMRNKLKENLIKLGSKRYWDHITNQIGMFCYSGLTEDQVNRLAKDFSVYMPKDGRIAVSGITTKNVEYLAKAIHDVTK